ncbi:unnamed protein product [Paramecium octaurelia]|uniref:Transmembrane protein n=1 Tax=Paramecium octaurelia TaxID=43137 RepID=A0A8S1VQP5_PAROT|nr:unnamed protein product [Paramecium octaurelia]
MKQSQISSFIMAQSQVFEYQDLNLSDFNAYYRKPLYMRQLRINQQNNHEFSKNVKKQIQNIQYLEKKREIMKNNNIKNQDQKLMTIEEFKKVQKQKRISISKEIHGKFIQEKQNEFLKLLSFCLAILIILVLIFHQNEPVQIQGLF